MAWVKDGTNYSFYKDGELFDSRAAPITFNTTNSGNTYRIGRATNYFEGNIDDVAIFNRALGSAEIAELASTILGGSEADLVGYWAFDEGDGTTAFDSSPNKGRRNNKTSHLIGPDYQIQTESLLTVGLPIQREQLG